MVTGVLALLAALALPAVQHARESSRLVLCKTNLSQIGKATNDFHSRFGRFPDGSGSLRDLLKVIDPTLDQAFETDQTNGMSIPSIYVCPSDNKRQDGYQFRNYSYFINHGWSFGGDDGMVDVHPRRSSDISDGFSNTACFSERLVDLHCRRDGGVSITTSEWNEFGLRLPYMIGYFYDAGEENEFLNDARQQIDRGNPLHGSFEFHDLGLGVILGYQSYYNHLAKPNLPWFQRPDNLRGMRPATSLHVGGVSLLYVDGHVSFISDSVDLAVWRAIGTVNGGESASDH